VKLVGFVDEKIAAELTLGAVVVTFTTTEVDCVPGVTETGATLHTVVDGAPVQLSATAAEKLPPDGET
jgi:hypothetical protein